MHYLAYSKHSINTFQRITITPSIVVTYAKNLFFPPQNYKLYYLFTSRLGPMDVEAVVVQEMHPKSKSRYPVMIK